MKSLEDRFNLVLTLDFLAKLPTKRLLAYYRKERGKFFHAGFFCSCCGTPAWEFDGQEHYEEYYKQWKERLSAIKAILDTREHI